jgi:hypothetical protein
MSRARTCHCQWHANDNAGEAFNRLRGGKSRESELQKKRNVCNLHIAAERGGALSGKQHSVTSEENEKFERTRTLDAAR